jgi:hypothetical protein
MDLDAEFGALSKVDEGDGARDDSADKMNGVTQKPMGAGDGAGTSVAAEQGGASNFTDFEGTLQVKYIPF